MTKQVKGKSIEDFRKAHDKSFIVPAKIKDGLAQLGESWEYEAEFIRRCSLCQTDMAAYRERFEDHFIIIGGKNPKRIWAGTKKLADQLREMT